MRKFNFLWVGEEYIYIPTGIPYILEKAIPGVCILGGGGDSVMCHPCDIKPLAKPLAPLRELVKMFEHEQNV